MTGKTIYDYLLILNLSTNELLDINTLKSNYRKLAKKFHPDNLETGNEQKFKKIQEAYEYCRENLDFVNQQISTNFRSSQSSNSFSEEGKFKERAETIKSCMIILGMKINKNFTLKELEENFKMKLFFQMLSNDKELEENLKIAVLYLRANFMIANEYISCEFDYHTYKAKEREKAEAERKAREKAEAERRAREKVEAERKAREKAEAERIAREKAEAERKAREKAEAERIAREKAEAERKVREKAEAERRAREETEAERKVREKAEAERKAKEKQKQQILTEFKEETKTLNKENYTDVNWNRISTLITLFENYVRECNNISLLETKYEEIVSLITKVQQIRVKSVNKLNNKKKKVALFSFVSITLIILFVIIFGDSIILSLKPHTHNYITETVDPTCIADGYVIYKCDCNYEYKSNYKDALGHLYSEWEEIEAATASTKGVKEKTCFRCDYKIQEEIPILGHTHNFVAKVTYKPTCKELGYTLYKCSCGDQYKDNYITMLEHSYSDFTLVKSPTNTEEGILEQTCKNCGEKSYTKIHSLLSPHKYEELVIDPTCTEKGYTEYTCTCGDKYVDKEVAAKGHQYGEWVVIQQPTETTTGLKERNCIYCKVKETQTIAVLSHTHKYTYQVVQPTCTEQGYTRYTCNCGDYYKTSYTSAKGHTYGSWTVVKEATETTTGLKERKCIYCTVKETQTIAVLSHTHKYTSKVVQPTCTEKGYTEYTCTCGDSYKTNYTNAKGHTYGSWTVVKEATETTTGLKERKCIYCTVKETQTIAVLSHSHSYTSQVVQPTCTEKGYTEYTCTCGDSYKTNYTNAKDHTYTSWTVTKEATETSTGSRYRQCYICKELFEEIIPMIPHVHKYTSEDIPSTCDKQGYTKYTCKCGDSYNTNYIDKLDHTFGEWVVVKEATETTEGLKERKCINCVHMETMSVPTLSHKHIYTITIVEPTCQNRGYTVYKCDCSYVYKSDYTYTTSHKEVLVKVLIASTCTTPGVGKYGCAYCGLDYGYKTIDLHNMELTKVMKEASCTQQGLGKYECKDCDEIWYKAIEQTQHTYAYNKSLDGYYCTGCGKQK